jgi:UDP-N-acetylmuramate--alanine ligase
MKLAAERMMFGNIGIIHFIGIGGIGMSGIAEILHNLGYKVQGSDIAENYVIKRLRQKGIDIFIGHNAENIEQANMVVKSSAVKDNNPEIIAAKHKHLMVIKRSEMLAELMRLKISIAIAGTHGKTTTTSLVASMFESASLNPTVINGGIINTHGTNAYLGSGDFLIAEADESDATFIKVPSTIGVITNIDPEHLDFYGDFNNLKAAFKTFIENLPFYGFGVLCKDHPEVAKLAEEVIDRRIITYGIERDDVEVRAINIKLSIDGSDFDVEITDYQTQEKRWIKDVHLPIAGIHNVSNSLSAIAIALQLKFKDEIIKSGFEGFKGVKRRFTKIGEVNGVTIIDDYAHHPKEIAVTIKTAKIITEKTNGKIIVVAQPHRYSRVSDLFSEFTRCFEGADIMIITDIYSAGEEPIVGINKEVLITSIKQLGYCQDVRALDNAEQLAKLILSVSNKNDIVLCLGAGNITNWAASLPQEIEKLNELVN